MAKIQDVDIPYLEFAEAAAPGTPAAAITRIYTKADGLMYSKDDAGVETLMSGGAGGGSVATDAIWDAKGDLAAGTGANTASRVAAGADGTVLVYDAAQSAGVKAVQPFGQTLNYPRVFAGDVIDGSSTTPFVDVDAFSTKEVLNSRVLHLRTLGASQDDRVRVTLGTTKAAAFDIRTCFVCTVPFWTSGFDTYFEISLRTSADAVVAIARIYTVLITANSAWMNTMRVGDTAVVGNGTNFQDLWPPSMAMTLQIKRDGSDNLTFFVGAGTAPLAMAPIIDGGHLPYTVVEAGTVARVEFSIHTPAGPGATAALDAYIDYVASV